MGFWNDVSKTLGNVADATVRETGRLAALTRLKYRLSCQRSQLSALYEQIGQLCYQEHAGQIDENSIEIAELCEKAADLKTQILVTQTAIDNMKVSAGATIHTCPKCGMALHEDMSFCPKCGSPIANEAAGNDDTDEQA